MAVSVALFLLGGVVYPVAQSAGGALFDTPSYVEAVLG